MAANSSVIGLLRILLSASTAEWDAALKRSQDSAKAWSKELRAVGQQATQVGTALTKTLTLPIAGVGIAAAKLAIDFESSFAGVRKTVDGTEPQLAELAQGFRDLSKTIPVNVNDLNRLGEAAGALGIPRDKIVDFAAVMAKLGVSTDLTADQAANAIARIQNIFGAAGKDTENLASTLVALGNAGASTEKEIVDMSLRIAGAGHTVGLTQAQVLAFASTLASVGINAEAGGSAISRVFLKINDAVQNGGSSLAEFARIAGVSTAQYKQAFETNAAGATQMFIEGLGRLKTSGENINQTIVNTIGKSIILKDTLFRLSGAGGLLSDQLKIADTAWKSNTALTKEAQERFKTTESQMTLLGNRVKDVGITLGNALGPAIGLTIKGLNALIPVLEKMAGMFAALPDWVQLGIVAFAAVVAAAGPVLYVFGQIVLSSAAIVSAFTKKGIATRALAVDFDVFGTSAATTTSKLGLLGKAAGLAAAFFVGWEIGTLIAELAGLDTAVARSVKNYEDLAAARARAMGKSADTGVLATQIEDLQQRVESLRKQGFGDSAEVAQFNLRLETLRSKLDVVNRAVSHGAAATISYTDAIKFNEQWETKRIAALAGGTVAQQKHTVTTHDNTDAHGKNSKAKAKHVELTSAQIHVLELLDKAHAHQTAALAMETAAWEKWQQTVSKALASLPTNPVLLQGRDLSGTVPQIGGAAGTGGNLAGTPLATAATAAGETLAAAMGKALQQLPNMLIQAFTGGGGVKGAMEGMGTLLGSTLGKSIGAGVKALGKFGGPIGEAIGALAGPLAGLFIDTFFGTKGRDTKLDLAKQLFGSVEEMQRQMVTLGQSAYDALWKQFSEVGQNDKGQAEAAIRAIVAALKAQKDQQDETAAATTKAAEEAAEAAKKQQEAIDAVTAKYADSFAKIDDEYKKLNDSVAAEAEEAEMGAQERLDRARMKELEEQKKALEAQRAAEIDAAKKTADETIGIIEKIDERIKGTLERGYKIPITFELPEGWPTMPGPGIPSADSLTSGFESSFGASTRALTSGASLTRADGGTTHAQIMLDGRVLTTAVIRHAPGQLAVIGVGR